MKSTTRQTRFSQETHYNGKLTLTESLLQSLSQTGLRPAFSEAATGGRIRLGAVAGGLLVLLVLVAAGLFLLRSDPQPAVGTPVAVLELARGSVGMFPASASQDPSRLLALDAGAPIHAGAVIETGRAGVARAALRLAGGGSLRLDADTRVRVASADLVELDRGAVYFDSDAGSGVEVRTTLGVVRDIGTQFEVRLVDGSAAASLRVRVREGAVVVEGAGGTHEAVAGVELTLDADGTLSRGAVPIHGPRWDWVLDSAPAPDLEGRPLSVFLDWVAREGGWELRFADGETAGRASTITLHGDVHDLTPAEAMAMVLDGSGLDYRLEAGTLTVGPAGS